MAGLNLWKHLCHLTFQENTIQQIVVAAVSEVIWRQTVIGDHTGLEKKHERRHKNSEQWTTNYVQ